MIRRNEWEGCYNVSLPKEILREIFDRTQDGVTVLKIREVCKFWLQAINEEYRLTLTVLKNIDHSLDDTLEKLADKSKELKDRIAKVEKQKEENNRTNKQCVGLLAFSVCIYTAPYWLGAVKYFAERIPPRCPPWVLHPGQKGMGIFPDGGFCMNL